VATAYYTLKNTKHNVLLIEGDKIAHGATGHNAGQLVTYFERPFSELVKEFGLIMAAEGQLAIESAWLLVDEIFQEAQLHTPLSQFTGYAAGRDIEEILVHIKNNSFRLKSGLSPQLIMVAEEAVDAKRIPKRYNSLFAFMPHKNILELLETEDTRYIAALPARKGCMNSALFCEELVGFLLTKYAGRFKLAENSLINQVNLEKDQATLTSDEHIVTAKKVILCTNGFEKVTILNKAGKQINAKFHQLVRGSVGYMAGYLAPLDKAPTAVSYLPRKQKTSDAFAQEPYFYLTRRPFELEENEHHNLVCVGGPEALMDDTNQYHQDHAYPAEAQEQIDKFLHDTYKYAPKGEIKYKFKWHGLMGYTPTGIRCIGPEPLNEVLCYNLGCNGAGLLHSIYGGLRISQHLAGEKLKPSIFDPKKTA
jgi:glycine/D-amino acid oxidase-like deaminating enzyme